VFVLHEVFATPYDEIAEAMDKSPAAVRLGRHLHRRRAGAARTPITGVRRVATFLGLVAKVVEDGLITRIFAIRNPDKLGWLEKVTELLR
jgi:DNA-binding Lrp family transcriptional regulator